MAIWPIWAGKNSGMCNQARPYKCKNHSDIGMQHAKSHANNKFPSITIKDTITIMHNPLSEYVGMMHDVLVSLSLEGS